MAGNHTLGTIRGTIEIDYDGAGIVRAVRDTNRLKRSGTGLDRTMNGIFKTFTKFAKGALIAGAAASTLHNVLGLVAGTLAVIGPLAAAGVAALPGIFLGAVVAVGVFKAAVVGVGDALKAAAGDAEEFNEKIKGLAPNARAFAVAYRGLLQTLKPVQQAIQNTFFAGTAPMIARVAANVLRLKFEAVGVASAFNGVVREVLRFAGTRQAVDFVGRALRGVHDFLLEIKPAIVPLIQAFGGLAGQAGEFGGTLGTSVRDALLSLAGFVSRVDLAGLFERAKPIVAALGTFLGNVGTIAKELFSIFNVDGANAAGVLGDLAGKLAGFLQSSEGQAALQALGQALQTVAGEAGQVFLTLLQQLAPIIVQLAPGIGELAVQLGNVLVPVLQTAGPLLESLARFLSENMSWLGPLAGVVLAAAAAYRVYATAAAAVETIQAAGGLLKYIKSLKIVTLMTKIWTGVQWLLNLAMTANPIGLVIIAIIALVAGIILLWKRSETFRNIVLAVWAAIKDAALAVVAWFRDTAIPFFKDAWDAIVGFFVAAHEKIKPALDFIANSVKTATAAIAASFAIWKTLVLDNWVRLFQLAWKAVTTSWNLIFGTIEKVVNFLRPFIIGWLEETKAKFMAVWNAVSFLVEAAFNFLKAIITPGVVFLRDLIVNWLKMLKLEFTLVWAFITTLVRGAINIIGKIFEGFKNILTNVRNFFNQLKAAATGGVGSLISFVAGIPGRLLGALANLGGLLFNKGRSIIQGLIDGIKSMFGSISHVMGDAIHQITDWLPGSPAKRGPLSGQGYSLNRGQRLVDDFATGILGAQRAVSDAMQRVASSAVVNMPVTVGTPAAIQARSTPIGMAAPGAVPVVTRSVSIQNLNLQGVWDMTDPTVPRQIVSRLHKALDDYGKAYH